MTALAFGVGELGSAGADCRTIGDGKETWLGSSRTICAGVTIVRLSAARVARVCASCASRSCWRASAAARSCFVAASSASSCARSRRSARQACTTATPRTAATSSATSRNQKFEVISKSQIMSAAGDDLSGVSRVGAAVPGEQRARGVADHGVEFLAQNLAADGEALLWIAEGGKKQGIKARFARDLPHHLHQAPGKAAGVRFRRGDLVVGIEGRDVLAEEGRLV